MSGTKKAQARSRTQPPKTSRKKNPRTPLTDEERRRVALLLVEGRIVSTNNVPKELWRSVFMPLGLMTTTQLKEHKGAVTVYAIRGEDVVVSGRAINGFPFFTSCRFLYADDADAIDNYATEFRLQRQQMLGKS